MGLRRPLDVDGKRWCCRCHRYQPMECFYVVHRCDGYVYDGPDYKCRECHAVQDREKRRLAGSPSLAELAERRAEKKAARTAARTAAELRRVEDLRAASARRQEQLRTSPQLHCSTCGETLARAEFYPTDDHECKRCRRGRDRKQFQTGKETLSDAYVKRQLTKYSNIAARDIPPSLIEAKRVQLQIQRLVSPRRPGAARRWLQGALAAGPVSAEVLNREAKAAGIHYETKQRALRMMGARYDTELGTWCLWETR